MRRALFAPLVVTLTIALVACGSDGGSGAPESTTATTEAPLPTDPPAPDLSGERALLVVAPVLTSGGCPPEVAPDEPGVGTPPSETPAGETTQPQPAPDAPDAPDTPGATTTTTATGSGPESLRSLRSVAEPPTAGVYPTADGIFCFTIGEPVADANDLTDATLSETDGEWQVLARVRPDSVDKLNALFNSCMAGEPTCPPQSNANGAAAFVWEGIVLFAPSITAEDMADGPFSLAGGLSERRARDLITLINR